MNGQFQQQRSDIQTRLGQLYTSRGNPFDQPSTATAVEQYNHVYGPQHVLLRSSVRFRSFKTTHGRPGRGKPRRSAARLRGWPGCVCVPLDRNDVPAGPPMRANRASQEIRAGGRPFLGGLAGNSNPTAGRATCRRTRGRSLKGPKVGGS